MRSRSVIVVTALLAVLLLSGAALVLYDHSQRETIAEGVRVAGVDVGGLTTAQARARVERDYLARLREPVVVHHGQKTFRLSARESRVGADLGGMIDEAVERTRDGNPLTRSWRSLTGGEVAADVSPRTTYSREASLRLVDRIRAAVDRTPRDASLSYSADGLTTVAGHDGLAVRASELRREVERAIVDPDADHTLVARTERVAPAVTTEGLAAQNETVMIVNRKTYRLKLFKRLELAKTYEIAVGDVGFETPTGLYHIQNKAIDPAWTKPHSDWVKKEERGDVVPGGDPDNPLKARWLGIYDGAGIHGIDPSQYGTIGSAASHGCVRMRISDVKALYDEVPVGAAIYIA